MGLFGSKKKSKTVTYVDGQKVDSEEEVKESLDLYNKGFHMGVMAYHEKLKDFLENTAGELVKPEEEQPPTPKPGYKWANCQKCLAYNQIPTRSKTFKCGQCGEVNK